MAMMRWITLTLAVQLGLAPSADAQSLTVSAAISMKDAVTEIGKGFTAARPGVTLLYNWGSSGELQKQIEAGAPDRPLHLGAQSCRWTSSRSASSSSPRVRRVFARNLLTVIKPADSRVDIAKPADLADPRVARIVVGNPRTVPAGQYAGGEPPGARALGPRAAQADLRGERAPGAGVRGARRGGRGLRLHHRRGAPRPGGEGSLPARRGHLSPDRVPGRRRGGARQLALAQAFVELLRGREGQAVLGRFGFQPPPAGVRWRAP